MFQSVRKYFNQFIWMFQISGQNVSISYKMFQSDFINVSISYTMFQSKYKMFQSVDKMFQSVIYIYQRNKSTGKDKRIGNKSKQHWTGTFGWCNSRTWLCSSTTNACSTGSALPMWTSFGEPLGPPLSIASKPVRKSAEKSETCISVQSTQLPKQYTEMHSTCRYPHWITKHP